MSEKTDSQFNGQSYRPDQWSTHRPNSSIIYPKPTHLSKELIFRAKVGAIAIFGAICFLMGSHIGSGDTIARYNDGEQRAKVQSEVVGRTCVAEVNHLMPEGYEITCK